jgi:hypothetical protein
MRPLITRVSMTLLVTSGLVALGATSALAASAPAPFCQSYNTTIDCTASGGLSSYTWTETIKYEGTSYTSTFAAANIRGACERNAGYTLSYSYVKSGVTYNSAATTIVCSTEPPE